MAVRQATFEGIELATKAKEIHPMTTVINWSARVSDSLAQRRAGGRRRYNAVRRVNAECRKNEVARLLRCLGLGRGSRAEIARRLGVSRATVTRDVQALFAEATFCAACGRSNNEPSP